MSLVVHVLRLIWAALRSVGNLEFNFDPWVIGFNLCWPWEILRVATVKLLRVGGRGDVSMKR